jgi:hypothetical protein
MKWIRLPICELTILVGAAVLATAGCSECVNPWADDLPRAADVTTPSVEGVRAADRQPARRTGAMQPSQIEPQPGVVTHWPLWWEDPFVDKGSEDGQFAMTVEDYIALPYGLGRFILNTMAFPVSATVTPPGTIMGSDGVLSRQALGYDHDAQRWPGSVVPIDILEVGTVPQDTERHDVAPDESENETSS